MLWLFLLNVYKTQFVFIFVFSLKLEYADLVLLCKFVILFLEKFLESDWFISLWTLPLIKGLRATWRGVVKMFFVCQMSDGRVRK